MKTTTTLITLCISALSLKAQEVILTRANVPSPGTIYINYDANVPSNPFTFSKTGTGNTWDFTSIPSVPGQDDTINYVIPFAVDNFPASDIIAYENGDKSYSFIKLQDNGAYVVGLYGDLVNSGKIISFPFTTPVLAKPFPFNASTQYQGSVSLDTKKTGAQLGYPVDSVWLNLKSSTKIKVIASGNIILPSGTFPAILEMSENVSIDTIRAKFSAGSPWTFVTASIETDTTYKWYTQASVEPYAHAIYKGGLLTDVSYHKATIPLSLGSEKVFSSPISCYPNPVRETLYFDMGNEKLDKLTIVSGSGNEINCKTTSANSIDVSELHPGIYVARIQLKNGQVRLSTFVKN